MLSALFMMMFFQQENVFIDRVAIKVNDKIITEREVVNAYRQNRSETMQRYTGAELDERLKALWTETVESLEERLLLFEKANELGMAVSSDDARARMLAVQESNGLSDEEFEKLLVDQTGMTLDEYIDFTRREQSAQYVVTSQVVRQIDIEDSEIAKYYDENIDDFLEPETYRIAEIVILKGQNRDTMARAREALAWLAQNDGDFAAAAGQFSDSASRENGGDLGFVEYGDFNEAIEDRVRQMAVGDVSEPFETAAATFLIKLLDRVPATPKKLEDVREIILNRLREPRLAERMVTYIEELKEIYLLETYVKTPPKYLGL